MILHHFLMSMTGRLVPQLPTNRTIQVEQDHTVSTLVHSRQSDVTAHRRTLDNIRRNASPLQEGCWELHLSTTVFLSPSADERSTTPVPSSTTPASMNAINHNT